MKAIDHIWVSTLSGILGIIVLENDEGKRTLRAAAVAGHHPQLDLDHIAKWGGRINPCDLARMLDLVNESPKET